MILFYILSPLLSGLLLYYILGSSSKRTLFEKIAISYISGLSLYALLISLIALILGGTIIYEITYGVLVVLIGIGIWKKYPFKHFIRDTKKGVSELYMIYKTSSWTSRLVGITLILYCMSKIVMSFMITTSRLTYDEDAVASWDLKSKVFTFQKSLVLDGTSKEFLGTAPSRIVYGPIIDTILIGSNSSYFDFYSNIVSPLTYLILGFFVIGYMYRKTKSVGLGLLSGYISLSLPFVFYQAVGSYWNLSFGVGVMIFGICIAEYISGLHNNTIQLGEIVIISLLGFWVSAVRNEGIYYMGILVFITAITYLSTLRKISLVKLIPMIIGPISLSLLGYVLYKIMLTYEQITGSVAHLSQIASGNTISKLIENISGQPVFKALLSQIFYHPDYSYIIIVFMLLSLLGFGYYKNKENRVHLFQFLALFLITVVVLFSNLELGLLSHYVFIRYALSFIFFVPLIIVGLIHYIHEEYIK